MVFGIDLGASYKILDNLTVSTSIFRLGFISWKKGATKIANATPPDININVSDYTKDINVDDLTSNDLKITDAMTKLQTESFEKVL